jgi:endonuclease YncB( thermonuclease family)
VLLILVLACGSLGNTAAERETLPRGKVLRVLDSKRCVIRIGNRTVRVHLEGVTTPAELNPAREAYYHNKAIRFLKRFIQGKQVSVEFVERPVDALGCKAVYLYRVSDNLFVNFSTIHMGFGHARLDAEYEYKRLFRYGERQAREAGVGLWGVAPPEKRSVPKTELKNGGLSGHAGIYLTGSDKKYHRDYCHQLRESRYPMKLDRARQAGYVACEFCLPRQKSVEPNE